MTEFDLNKMNSFLSGKTVSSQKDNGYSEKMFDMNKMNNFLNEQNSIIRKNTIKKDSLSNNNVLSNKVDFSQLSMPKYNTTLETSNNKNYFKSNLEKDLILPKADHDWRGFKDNVSQPKFNNGQTKVNLLEELISIPQTAANILVETGKGILDFGESAADTLIQLGTSKWNPYYRFNPDKLEAHQEIATDIIKQDSSEKLIDILGYNRLLSNGNTVQQQLDKNSIVKSDNILGNVARGIGNMLPTIAVGNAGVGLAGKLASNLSLGVNAYGSGIEEAYNDGANRNQANLYGLGSAATEFATEWATGGIPGVKNSNKLLSGLDNLMAKSLGKKSLEEISSSVAKEILQSGYKMIAEGGEEVLSELIKPVLKNAIYSENEKVDPKEVVRSFIIGSITGGILEAPNNMHNIKNANSLNQAIQQQNSKIQKFNNNINTEQKNATQFSNLFPLKESLLNNFNNQSNTYTSKDIVNVPNLNENIQSNIGVPTSNQISKLKYNENEIQQSLMKNGDFSEQIDKYINKSFPTGDVLYLGNTPKILQNLGISDNPIILKQSKLKSLLSSDNIDSHNHGLTADLIKKIPNALENPLNILKSSTQENSIVVITDLADLNENPIIASITLDDKGQIGNIEFLSNRLSSAYGKNNYDDFMKREIDKGNLLYDIDEGIKKELPSTGLQLPKGISSFSVDNVPQSNNNVKSSTLQNYSMQNNQNNTTNNVKTSGILPTYSQVQEMQNNRILNPVEISNLTLDDANTTPKLSATKRNNSLSTQKSSFYKNVTETSKFLNENSRNILSKESDVQYYKGVTNKESLQEAKVKLDNGGTAETLRWLKQDSKTATATDIAEGWILLKQYQDVKDYDSMIEIAKKMREMGTSAGQTIQAFNIMQRLTPEGMVKYAQSELSEAFDRMSKNQTKKWIDSNRSKFDLTTEEVQFIMDTMNEVQTMNDGYDKKVKLAQIQKLMTDKLPLSKGAGIRSWMRISMLFNPKTQVRNVVGNAVIMPVNAISDIVSSYADKVISKKTGVRTSGNINVKAMIKGFKEGAYQATNDYKKGINTKDMDGNRFEIGEGKSFTEKTIIGKSLNNVEGMLNYVMDIGDRMFSQSSFENSLQNQMLLNNVTEATQEMIDIARTESLQRTWNDNNGYTKFVLDVRKGLNKINIKNYGLGDILIPFAKTPANLTKAIVDYSPLGLVNSLIDGYNLKKSLSNEQYTAKMQHKFVQNLGKATAGTMLYILGYSLAKAGIISGESDDDKDISNFMKNTLGVSSYSIKIGNKSFTYDWAQPIAAPLSMMGNIVNSKNKGTAFLESVISSLDSAGSILLEQSFLQSLNDVLNDNDGVVSGLINEVLQLPARAVPTFSKQIVDMTDSTQRTSYEYGKPLQSAINSIKAKIPGLSKTLAPSVDTLGREIQRYGGKNNIFNVFLNPANINTENISESAKEIYRLYKETGETNIMPRVSPYYINKNGEKIILSAEKRSHYQKISGKIIEDNIQRLLKLSNYNIMNDKDKASVVNDVVNYAYSVAQYEVLGTEISQTYSKAYQYSKIGDINDYYIFKNSIDATDKDTKKSSIVNYLINSSLDDKQLAFLYKNYYSNEDTLNNILNMEISMKEFIKFNSQDFDSDTNSKGDIISGSRKQKVINYVNKLNLSIPQKAILIKKQYSSFNDYNDQIIEYINKQNINSNEKSQLLKELGFTVYTSNGKVYVRGGS